jgi:hypothetical protein
MVDICSRLAQVKEMIDAGLYFTINRARQYGKTTMLSAIWQSLSGDYICVKTSFEGLGNQSFATEEAFCVQLMKLIQRALKFSSVSADKDYIKSWYDTSVKDFDALDEHITEMCRDKSIVLMIDEVDKTSNNSIYIQFLGRLRDKYLKRREGKDYTFHSVILAGVYDIKNIKLKLINEGIYTPTQTEGKLLNSPWNIAADFKVDMSFHPDDIATMLNEYEADHDTGMNIAEISDEIYSFTNGYPYWVSRLCKNIDEDLNANWTVEGVTESVKMVLVEPSTLFDDMFKNIASYPELRDYIYELLIVGITKAYSVDNPTLSWALMFGFVREHEGKVAIANRIFEIRISNYFVSIDDDRRDHKHVTGVLQYDVIRDDGSFDMELTMRKYAEHFREIFTAADTDFIERQGRLLFLSYIKPLINGKGFYHIESGFTDLRRMDLVIDYGSEQFIVELKIWHGKTRHEEAYDQLCGYLEKKNANTGYLLTNDFRKNKPNEPTAQWVEWKGRRIFDVVV